MAQDINTSVIYYLAWLSLAPILALAWQVKEFIVPSLKLEY